MEIRNRHYQHLYVLNQKALGSSASLKARDITWMMNFLDEKTSGATMSTPLMTNTWEEFFTLPVTSRSRSGRRVPIFAFWGNEASSMYESLRGSMWNLTILSSNGEGEADRAKSGGAKMVTELKLVKSWATPPRTVCSPTAKETKPFELSILMILGHSTKFLDSTTLELEPQMGVWIETHWDSWKSWGFNGENGPRTPWTEIGPPRKTSGWDTKTWLISTDLWVASVLVIESFLCCRSVERQLPRGFSKRSCIESLEGEVW